MLDEIVCATRDEAVRFAVLALRADPDCEPDDAVSICRELGLRVCETGGCPDCLVVRKDDPRSVDEIVAAVGRRN